MTIEDADTVDLIGTEKGDGAAVLVISDHLDWNDTERHLKLLQEKINAYLAFIESGEMYDRHPSARGAKIVIKVVGAHALAAEGIRFFQSARPVLEQAGVDLRFSRLDREAS
jgi:hypothetical protein